MRAISTSAGRQKHFPTPIPSSSRFVNLITYLDASVTSFLVRNMISAVAWVPKGVAKLTPVVAQPTADELRAIREHRHENDGDDANSRYFNLQQQI